MVFPHFSWIKIITLFLSILLYNCSTVHKVGFKEEVDTTTKQIRLQEKRIFQIEGSNIYASNKFDGARLSGFSKLNDSTASVYINPENIPINNSPYYAFKIWSDVERPYYLTFNYPTNYEHRYVPKLKSGDIWKEIDSTQLFNSNDAVTIKLNLTAEPKLIAAQKIQTSHDVATWYNGLIDENNYINRLHIYGSSRMGRDLPVLEIGNGESLNKDVVILLTRQHPPEVTGYFAFQKFLETIISMDELSEKFYSKYTVLAFPILNPDGVDLGHWRHNEGGVDLNRDWSKYNQPEIRQTVKFINKYLDKNKSKIVLGIDFHSTWKDVFYTNEMREGTAIPNFIDDWFDALEMNIPGYEVNEAASNSTKPVSKGWFLYGHNAVGITYEIGDKTKLEDIEEIGKVSAEQMIKILINNI